MDITNILGLLGGLALFLHGMQMMSSGLEAAAGSKMKLILERLTANRFLGVLVGAGITAVLELLDIDARLADVPRPEKVGLLDRISAALTDTDMNSPSYKRLELE